MAETEWLAGRFEQHRPRLRAVVLASAGFWMNVALINKPTPVPA